MIATSKFMLDESGQEHLSMGAEDFPYLCCRDDLYIGQNFSWHWHPAFEINYVADGSMEFRTPENDIFLKKGEAVFINSNVMHEVINADSGKKCTWYTHFFSTQFLSGRYNSRLEQKYLIPILQSRQVEAFTIRPDHYETLEMAEHILHAVDLARQEPYGYEFEIRTELSRFWCLLLKETEPVRAHEIQTNSSDVERVKQMMEFIHLHYDERITLDEIASSASISSRECTRCFQRCVHAAPIEYLNEYRVQMASQALLQTEDTVLTISENCGFSSSSYFGKVFREMMKCTPVEYRKKWRNQQEGGL